MIAASAGLFTFLSFCTRSARDEILADGISNPARELVGGEPRWSRERKERLEEGEWVGRST
jgi:hypothetical protein